MLSRVAERLYWMARYLERAENTARLLDVHQTLMLDLPTDARVGWMPVLDILGCREVFDQSGCSAAPDDIQLFISAGADNPGSLLHSLQGARENARTTRDLIPTEVWRAINELQIYADERLPRAKGRMRKAALSQVVSRCQMVAGQLMATMSRDAPYQLIRAGRSLERADMTTRSLDAAAALLLAGRDDLKRYDNTLWMAVLRSMSAYQMYRQQVRRRVCGPDVMEFLLQNRMFPRAVGNCLAELEAVFAELPRPAASLDALRSVQALLHDTDTRALSLTDLHGYIDQLQRGFGDVHLAVSATWFLPQEKRA